MRRITILFLWLSAFMLAVPAHAQFKWGVEGGLNVSKISMSSDVFDTSNRTGWFIGPKAQFSIPVIGLGIDGALLYSQKYLDISPVGEGAVELGDSKGLSKSLPYLEIPVNLKYNIGFSSLIGAYISTGPQYSLYLGGRNLTFADVNLGTLKETNFSWNIGVGINAFSHLQLGVTYNIAMGKTGEMTDLSSSLAEVFKQTDLKNNTWQLRLAYMF